MTQFRFTSPEGKKYDVNAPEGATREEAFAILQQQLEAKPAPSFKQRATDALKNISSEFLKGMTQGGPPVAMVRGLASGIRPLAELENEAITKGAYEGGGYATDLASKAGLPPALAGGLGFATNVGIQAAPTFLSGEIAGRLAAPVLRSAGEGLMGSALKPTPNQWMSGKGKVAVDTMLKKGENVSSQGIINLKTSIDKIGRQVEKEIGNSTATVNKQEVAGRILDAYKAFEHHPNRVEAFGEIRQVMDEFLKHPAIKDTDEIPIQLAQKLKQGFGKALGDVAYGERKTPAVEAVKALTRGFKEEIATKVPSVSTWNKQESALIKTLEVAERRAMTEMNKNVAGLSLLAENPIAGAAFMGDRSSWFKSLLARMLYSGAESVPKNVARGGVAAYEMMSANRGH